jgi:hypothetical protein
MVKVDVLFVVVFQFNIYVYIYKEEKFGGGFCELFLIVECGLMLQ